MSPKFSVIVPVFNVEKYLEEAVNSLLEQTYSSYEIILVNDGSTDSSGEICRKYKENNKQIILIEQENKGLSEARNIGKEHANGEFIYYFDSDDILAKNALYDWWSIFKSNNVDIIFFEGEAFGIKNESLKYNRAELHHHKIIKSNIFLHNSKIDGTYTPSPCLYVIKRSIAKINQFHPKIIHEDELYYAKLLLREPINTYVSPVVYFKRRLRPDSIMTKKKTNDNYYGYETVLREILKDSKILSNKKTVLLIVNDLIREMCKIAIEVDGGVVSLKKRASLLNVFRKLLKNSLLTRTSVFCIFPELKRLR